MQPKIAIKIDNQAQFEALMKHYEEKGWTSWNKWSVDHVLVVWKRPNFITYENGFQGSEAKRVDTEKVLTFEEFSLLTGVKAEEPTISIPLGNQINALVTKDIISIELPARCEGLILGKNDFKQISKAFESLQ